MNAAASLQILELSRVNGGPLRRAIPREAVAQIAEYQRLRALTTELVDGSEGLCRPRL